MVQHKLPLTKELFEDPYSRTWKVKMYPSARACPSLPAWLVNALGLPPGQKSRISLRLSIEADCFAFQRITDADAESVKSAWVYASPAPVGRANQQSAEHRLCAQTATPGWVFLHQ